MGSVLSYFVRDPDDHVLDSTIGLTGREKRLVRETWSVLRVNSINTGVAIMTRWGFCIYCIFYYTYVILSTFC